MKGVNLILGSKVQCLFCFETEGRGVGKGGSANSRTKHTEPLTQGLISPLYVSSICSFLWTTYVAVFAVSVFILVRNQAEFAGAARLDVVVAVDDAVAGDAHADADVLALSFLRHIILSRAKFCQKGFVYLAPAARGS